MYNKTKTNERRILRKAFSLHKIIYILNKNEKYRIPTTKLIMIDFNLILI